MRKLMLIILLLVTAVSCGGGTDETEPPPRAQPSNLSSYKVRYHVRGSAGSADITIENKDGGTEQKTVSVPWMTSFDAKPGQFVYISAQSNDDGDRTISCEILVNGETIQSAESSGQYVIASCSGSAEPPE